MIGRENDRAVFVSYYAHRNPGQIIFFLCGEFIKYCFFIYIFSGDKAMLFQISHEHGQRPVRLVIIASEIHGGIGALLFHMSFQMIRDAAGGECRPRRRTRAPGRHEKGRTRASPDPALLL